MITGRILQSVKSIRYPGRDNADLNLLAFSRFECFSHSVGEVTVFLFVVNRSDGIFLVSFVFSTNGQADSAVFTVNAGEFSFNVVAYAQNQSGIFNAVTGCFRSTQVTFNAVGQFYGCAFSVNCSHFTVNDGAFLVQCNPVVERIFSQLLNAQGDTLALCVNLQNNGCDFVAFFVFTYCFFACNVPGDVRQVNQAVDTAVQADEDTEVSDRLDFTFNAVALVVGFCELLPRVRFALLKTQGDTTCLLYTSDAADDLTTV